jgi:predicted NBD/HSP70 family sugar kinase
MNVLVVDVGGTHVKVLASGQAESRQFDSGPALIPKRMVLGTQKIAKGWSHEVVSIGYPGPVLHNRPGETTHLRALRRAARSETRRQAQGRRHVVDVVARLVAALEPDDVVVGGGNVKHLNKLPPGFRMGDNANAFLGGFRLWEKGAEKFRPSCAEEDFPHISSRRS